MKKHVLMTICLIIIMVVGEVKSKTPSLLDFVKDNGRLKNGKLSQSYFVPIGKIHSNKHELLKEQLLKHKLTQEINGPSENSNGIVINNLTVIYNHPNEHIHEKKNVERCFCRSNNDEATDVNTLTLETLQRCSCSRSQEREQTQSELLEALARCDCSLRTSLLGFNENKEKVLNILSRCGCRPYYNSKKYQNKKRNRYSIIEEEEESDVVARCSCSDNQAVDGSLRELLDRCNCQLADNSHDQSHRNYKRSHGSLLDDLSKCDCSTADRMVYNSDQDVDNVHKILSRCGCSNSINIDDTKQVDNVVARCDCSLRDHVPRTRQEELYLSNLLARCNCADHLPSSLSETVRSKNHAQHRDKNIVPLHLLLPSEEHEGSKKYESDFEFKADGDLNSKYYTPNSLVKYIFGLQSSVVDAVVRYVNNPNSETNSMYRSFSFLTAEQQKKIALLKLFRKQLTDDEITSAARDIIFGKSTSIDNLINKKSLRNSGPYYVIDRQYHNNQYREDAPTPQVAPVKTPTIIKKSLLPLTKKQKLKKFSRNLLKDVNMNLVQWGREDLRKSSNKGQYVAPFEVELDGLMQLNS